MKKFFMMFAAGFLLASSSAMAGNVASSSLSSLRPNDNPAVQGFNENEYEFAAISESTKKTAGTTDSTDLGIEATYESLFIGVRSIGNSSSDTTVAALGWAWDTLSLAAYSYNYTYTGGSGSITGAGLVWKLGDTIYLGFSTNSGTNSSNQDVGLAWKLDDKFRIDIGSKSQDNSGTTTTTSTMDIEYQWDNFVVGYSSKSATNQETTTYLAWEPEKDGFAVSIGILGSDETDFESGTEIAVGYNF